MAVYQVADNERPRGVGGFRRAASALLGVAMLAAAPLDAWGSCKPTRARPKITLKSMGPCAFDPKQLQFAGDAKQQAACLVRPVAKRGKLGPALDRLPEALAARVGQSALLPARETLSAYLSAQGLEDDFAAHLWLPVTRANDNDPAAPMARYFVIHDTSGPFLRSRPFPANIDTHRKINNSLVTAARMAGKAPTSSSTDRAACCSAMNSKFRGVRPSSSAAGSSATCSRGCSCTWS